ncbi:MAG TPA: gephyrin-like molybdotransferase Glp [Novosphingobium sp.]|nr:gephyrin-like molybdotransferase Glp [Novosphingobium sp.]HZV10631.1 gephyrin-like molybdotransferase Glp [Novosphingobium sp.]
MSPPLLPLDEAQARLLALATPLPVEHADMASALGHYLAEPLHAHRTQPAADLSAMDGYAVAPGDLAGPWQVVGESAAGRPFGGHLQAGEAARVSTGAVLPAGAGAVLLQEDITRSGAHIALTGTAPAPHDRHIRRAGFDFAEGQLLLPAGTRMGAAQVALAISGGHGHVAVRRPVRLAILDSGDELAAPGQPCQPHQIPASNGAMLAALVAALPCEITRAGPVADRLELLVAALDGLGAADVIVTSGGASVGDHDLIRPALEAWGAELDFWKVAMRPGKPLLVARRGRQVILGLPGNPVSALATAYFFLRPLLRKLLGASQCLPRPICTTLAAPLGAGSGRRDFPRGVWDGAMVRPLGGRDSSALAELAGANCLIDRPIGQPALETGKKVNIYLIEPQGFA